MGKVESRFKMINLTGFRVFVSIVLAIFISFGTAAAHQNSAVETFDDLMGALDTIRSSEDPAEREALVDQLWETLIANEQVPFIDGEQVALLYRGEARRVAWVGEFNGWDPYSGSWRGEQVG